MSGESRWLPEDFWTARPKLSQIRQAAHSRQRSADAVLHVVLARVAAGIPHTIKLPAIVGAPAPLCHFAVNLAPPGSGKGDAAKIGTELVALGDHVADQLPIGSGEGIVEALFDDVSEMNPDTGKREKRKRQTKHNAFVYVDEGDMLAAVSHRQGSTLLSTLRTIWSGSTLGNTNASPDRKRIVPAGQYTYGVIVGLQPALAGPLLEEAKAGTPQRFCWAPAVDPAVPEQPPAWPMSFDWTPEKPDLEAVRDKAGYMRHYLRVADRVSHEIRANDLARQRGATLDLHQAHAELSRLKVAGLLAVLESRYTITDEDWELAGVVKAASDANLDHARAVVDGEAARHERAASDRNARRQVAATAATEGWRTVKCAEKIRAKVVTDPGILVSKLRRDIGQRWRDVVDDGLAYGTGEGWFHERREPSHSGDDKRSLWRGRPS